MIKFLRTGELSPTLLYFREQGLEHSFSTANILKNKRAVQAGLISGSFAFAFFLLTDYLTLGRVESTIVWIRFLGFPLSNALLSIWLRFGKFEKSGQLDVVGGIYILMGQFWQFLVSFLYPELGPYYLFVFFLLSIYAQTSVNFVHFRYLMPSIVLILTAFLLKLFLWDELPVHDLAVQALASSMCIFLVLRSNYLIEKGHRLDFLKQIMLEKKQQELVSKNKELEQFAYIASHDLQEPLRSITSFSGLINEEFRDQIGVAGAKYLDYLLEASNRMRNLIKGLLDYSRLGRELQLVSINTANVLDGIRVDLMTAIQESEAKITAGKLPTIKGYETEFRQLLQNLLSNAIKFRVPGAAPEIHVSAQQVGGFWEFSVKDNGIGIAPENHDKIFLIFQRLHTRSTYEGTGIGLANCRKIAELHGGTIRVESEYQQGSNFIFTIPIR